MNNTTHSVTSRLRPIQLWTVARNELSERRQERAQYRALQRELASYTTRGDVDDLLGTIEDQEGAEVDMIRSILANNLMQQPTHAIAS
jgi:hypothetical protein